MDRSMLDQATTVWGLVAARAERTPDAPALIDEHDHRLSFGGLQGRAEAMATWLSAWGIGPGTRVAWQLPTAIDTIVLSVALARLGATQNPIIPIYRSRELVAILGQGSADVAIVSGDRGPADEAAEAAAAAQGTPPVLRSLAELRAAVASGPAPGAALPPPPVRGGRANWLYNTSGTTSTPKGVRHTDASLLAAAAALAEVLDVRATDVGSIAFPYAHIGGPDYLGVLLLAGIPAVVLGSFEVGPAVEVFRRHGVTIAGGTTAFYTALLRAQRDRPGEPLLPALRLLAGGGAPKPPEVFHQVRQELGVPIVHGWAMTECPMVCCGTTRDTDEQLACTEGRPVRGAEVKVVDERGDELAPGVPGELAVRGPMLFQGYADPTLDGEAFDADGFFRTGDLGCFRPDGHLVITGRRKDVIIRKGENISAREVEDLLYEHPAIAEVAVIGLPDADRGERLCAVVQLRPGAEPVTVAELAEHCRAGGLAIQKAPEQVELVDALPRNATGKVLKAELRERFAPVG